MRLRYIKWKFFRRGFSFKRKFLRHKKKSVDAFTQKIKLYGTRNYFEK